MKGKDAAPYVHQAIECGFSHIDTAQGKFSPRVIYENEKKSVNAYADARFEAYHNEESVGVAIRENGLSRDELYVTTKYARGNIQEAVRESLAKVGPHPLTSTGGCRWGEATCACTRLAPRAGPLFTSAI